MAITRNVLSSTANNHRRSNHPPAFAALGRPALRVMNRHRPMPANPKLLIATAAPQNASCHLGSAPHAQGPNKKLRSSKTNGAIESSTGPHAAVAWSLESAFQLKGRLARANARVHSAPWKVGGGGGPTRWHNPKGYEAGCLAIRGAPTNRRFEELGYWCTTNTSPGAFSNTC